MTSSTAGSWNRIEAWLAEHAPHTFARLGPPADPAEITAAEQTIGSPFPDPLRESLLRHDGTEHAVLLPPFWMPLSTRLIVDAWKRRTRIYESDLSATEAADDGDAESEFGPWWHRQWIPFAADGAGDHLVIDQRPTRVRGRIGDADHESGCRFEAHPMWASLPALLDMTATALESGELLECYERVVVDTRELDWKF
ncbi:SMI1/KNR4 family protein [Streptomyces sp. NBC_01571]|uniref:SMI1/KNR4 family protein n=1 Tax=unclassified Streptomyces TaxID=2593676 RepID=UPI0022515D31|nr:SMI1/KNR4 family protein [Streptomyces sp. NBC_01571]MCX4578742.1 SMI1/KNR4 family protein [Streptomyces sp. NBC_01571]